MSWENLPILIILVLAALGNNQSVSVAAAVLLVIKLLGFNNWFPVIESKGMNIGLIILTIAILAPVASGRITLRNMFDAFNSPVGLLAIAAGIFAAYAAGRGLFFIKETPEMVASLVVGTVIGVSFLKGVAIGPLIAGGMVSLVVALFGLLRT
jgi:Predicted membrane protein